MVHLLLLKFEFHPAHLNPGSGDRVVVVHARDQKPNFS